tara:strand:- start:196 stop:717 length:522 start_codon:yes stop_codon:yes gene_type:complete
MKKYLIFFFLFFNLNTSYADNNIVYLDVQFIINNSEIGKIYKSKIKTLQDKIKLDIEKKQTIIKNKEIDLNNQKNILKKDEFDKKIKEIKELVNNYQKFKSDMQNKIKNEKKSYSSEILKILNPLLTNYVENNNINLVVEKKNILVGIKTLDITDNILSILNNKTKELKINEN